MGSVGQWDRGRCRSLVMFGEPEEPMVTAERTGLRCGDGSAVLDVAGGSAVGEQMSRWA